MMYGNETVGECISDLMRKNQNVVEGEVSSHHWEDHWTD